MNSRTNRSRRPRRRVAGMSLVETSCATAILALAIGGLTNLAATTAALHQFGVEKSAAVRAIEREIAAIVASDFTKLTANWNGAGFVVQLEGTTGKGLVAQKGDADKLPGSVIVTAPTGDASELVEIEVRVDWVCKHGPTSLVRRVQLSRLGSGS